MVCVCVWARVFLLLTKQKASLLCGVCVWARVFLVHTHHGMPVYSVPVQLLYPMNETDTPLVYLEREASQDPVRPIELKYYTFIGTHTETCTLATKVFPTKAGSIFLGRSRNS